MKRTRWIIEVDVLQTRLIGAPACTSSRWETRKWQRWTLNPAI